MGSFLVKLPISSDQYIRDFFCSGSSDINSAFLSTACHLNPLSKKRDHFTKRDGALLCILSSKIDRIEYDSKTFLGRLC